MNTVLLIEPDRVLAEIYKRALEADGSTTVTTVSSAQTAIMAADTHKPDMVVLELQLIEHSGIEFLYEFRSYPEWQGIPILVQTMVPFGEFRDNWQLLQDELGVRAYLYKPHTSLHQLQTYVREHSLVVT
jgi:two-component system cell cycle response regulator DivK